LPHGVTFKDASRLQSLPPVLKRLIRTLLKCALKQIITHNDRAYPIRITIHHVQHLRKNVTQTSV